MWKGQRPHKTPEHTGRPCEGAADLVADSFPLLFVVPGDVLLVFRLLFLLLTLQLQCQSILSLHTARKTTCQDAPIILIRCFHKLCIDLMCEKVVTFMI